MFMRTAVSAALFAAGLLSCLPAIAETAKGVVFHDANGNGKRDDGEAGLPGVSVSNGVDVVQTGADGAYSLAVTDDTILFVIKPSGWRTAYDHNGTVARFYYIHKPNGSPKTKYQAVAPTGPLPESVDFALTPNEESQQFRMVVMGDPQPRGIRDVDFLSHDVYEELINVSAQMGASMGDLVFDGLQIYPDIIAQAGLTGIPWLHVIGNHDINMDIKDRKYSDETYEYWLGPSYYATNYADVHVIVLNNIWWKPEEREYEGRFGENQIAFVKNNLAHVSKDKLIVLMMHIPLWDCADVKEMLAPLAAFPHTFSLSAHTHVQSHRFLPVDGTTDRHHHLNLMTAGGSWLRGSYDELGIPHATMRDGGPNGYAVMNINGNQFDMQFKAARRPAEYQMDVWAPEEVSAASAGSTEVIANFFSGNEKSKLEMRLDKNGEWMEMTRFTGKAPFYQQDYDRQVALVKKIAEFAGKDANDENVLKKVADEFDIFTGMVSPEPGDTPHLWKATLPGSPVPGYHVIQVRATDMWGKVHTGQRIIRVLP